MRCILLCLLALFLWASNVRATEGRQLEEITIEGMELFTGDFGENPFRDRVRFQPCHSLVDSFKDYCRDQFERTRHEDWLLAKQDALATLRGYIKEDFGSRRSLVVGCLRDNKRSCVAAAPEAILLCRLNEDHTHPKAITIIDEYIRFNGVEVEFFPPFYALNKPTVLIDRQDYKLLHRAHVTKISELKVDRLGVYPLDERSADLPTNFFNEIYFERTTVERGMHILPDTAVQLMSSHLRTGALLMYDYNGGPYHFVTLQTSEKAPDTAFDFGVYEIRYSLDPVTGVIFWLPSAPFPFPSFQDIVAAWTEETWVSANLLSYFDKVAIPDDVRACLKKLWQVQAEEQASFLLKRGFESVTFLYDVINPRNNRTFSRLIRAVKKA